MFTSRLRLFAPVCLLLAALYAVASFCQLTVLQLTAAEPAPVAAASAKPAATEINPEFEKRILSVAKQYKEWGRVEEQPQFANTLCLPARATEEPTKVQVSSSKDDATHGRKLYYLFSNRIEDYRNRTSPYLAMLDIPPANNQQYAGTRIQRQPLESGIAVVKESWKPEEIAADKVPTPRESAALTIPRIADKSAPRYPYAQSNGKWYHAKEQAELFIMLKLDPKQFAGTDDGWIYATTTPDGKKVTAAGTIDSCVNCHREAKHDRLFGLNHGAEKEAAAKEKPATESGARTFDPYSGNGNGPGRGYNNNAAPPGR
ncbi:MAG: cytochrome P460 family protein [Planctomycetota bacterium]|nr:cytochrome P460 family protein [Planctomycetota bacterium]